MCPENTFKGQREEEKVTEEIETLTARKEKKNGKASHSEYRRKLDWRAQAVLCQAALVTAFTRNRTDRKCQQLIKIMSHGTDVLRCQQKPNLRLTMTNLLSIGIAKWVTFN